VQLEGADGKPHGWARWSLMVTRRPWPFLGGALAILIVLAIPLFSIDLGMVDSGSDPKTSTTYKAYGLVSKGFGPGSNGPIEVVLSGPNAQASAAAVAAAAKKVPDVAGTIGPIPSPTHPVSLITVVPQSAPASQATETLITQLESALQPVAGAGTQVYVTGTTAVGAELAAKVAARLPWFIGVVILISFILLMIEFRSLLVPLQAAIMNLLSVGAAFGVVVFVFQEGHGLSLIGVDQPVSIESWVPLMMFAILFGLSMDYEVFLLSRIREGWMSTGDPHKSVALGLAGTARVISAAALVMVCVFLAFVLEPNVVVKMLGVGLATAVLVDATVVRLMLVPAVMILVGKGNWWLPKWLDRILPTLKEPGQG
jgi:RND superfamily putative drug exporter